jgi:hypothetical protein
MTAIDESILNSFPKRPVAVRLDLKRDLTILISFLVAVAAIGFAILVAIFYLPALLEEPEIWRDGIVVPIRSLTGSCETALDKLPFTHCRFEIAYLAPDGTLRQSEVTALLFGGLDQDQAAVLKIAPPDPSRPDQADHLALSWLATAIIERWLTLGGICLLSLFLGAVLAFSGRRSWRIYGLYRRMGRKLMPVIVSVDGVRYLQSPDYAKEYRYRLIAGDKQPLSSEVRRQLLPVIKGRRGIPPTQWLYEEPIVLDPDHRRAIAAIAPNGESLLMLQSFWPFRLHAAEMTLIRNKVALAMKEGAAVADPGA